MILRSSILYRLLVVGLFSQGPTGGFTSRAEQAHAQKVVWMRGTWEETRKRQTLASSILASISFQSPSLQQREKLIG